MKKLYAYTVKMFVGAEVYNPITDRSQKSTAFVTKVEYFTDVDAEVMVKDGITYIRAEEYDTISIPENPDK
jgi:hypothetical protein